MPEEEREQEIGNLFEKIMTENFPNLGKEIDVSSGSTECPQKMNPNWPTPRHIIIKLPKLNTRENFKSSKRKAVNYLQGSPRKTCQLISQEKLQSRRDWQEIFKVIKRKDLQLRLLYPEMLSFRIEVTYKELPRQEKAKRIPHHQTSII